jgi:hypothetical protein
MICIKNICQFFCIGEIRSILGCAIGIVILVPVAVLFALPVGLVVGGWAVKIGFVLIGHKVEKVALLIGLIIGVILYVLLTLVIGATVGNFIGHMLETILKSLRSPR